MQHTPRNITAKAIMAPPLLKRGIIQNATHSYLVETQDFASGFVG